MEVLDEGYFRLFGGSNAELHRIMTIDGAAFTHLPAEYHALADVAATLTGSQVVADIERCVRQQPLLPTTRYPAHHFLPQPVQASSRLIHLPVGLYLLADNFQRLLVDVLLLLTAQAGAGYL